MARLPRIRPQAAGHQEPCLGRREKLPCALPRSRGELAEQIFIRPPQKVGLNIGKSQAAARVGIDIHRQTQFGRVDVAFAVPFGGEVHHIAVFFGQPIDFVIENIGKAFEKK